jgi:hypothetical protein
MILQRILLPSVDVDGHDFGSGEFNIFMLTSDPTASFRKVQQFVAIRPLPNAMAAAYRQMKALPSGSSKTGRFTW